MALFGLCSICGGDDLQGGEDGYFYCSACGSQSQQYQEQVLDYEALAGYSRRTQRSIAAAEEGIQATGEDPGPPIPSSQNPLFSTIGFTDTSKPWETASASWVAPHTPAEALDPMDTMDVDAASIRSIYIEGLQHIIQLQCETLVQNFHVSPLICGIVGPIWLRFIAFTCVLEKDWAKEVIQVEEARDEQRKRKRNKKKKKLELDEEQGMEDKTVQMRMALHFIWLGALKERIPLSVSLALTYLACHMAHESILPTDVVQWAARGSLPYLAAFCEIEKKRCGLAWPIEARLMFKPIDVIGASKLEFMAALIAKRIGLQLPPVNFDAISHRLLKELNLPAEKLSVYMRRFYDWYIPPELRLSDEAHALPFRVYVMAMVMIVLKVLYKIDGRLYTETHVVGCGKGVGSPSDRKTHDDQVCFAATSDASEKATSQKSDLQESRMADGPHVDAENLTGNATQYSCHDCSETETKGESNDTWNAKYLLEKLEKSWQDHAIQPFDYEKDLTPYLKYCQDIIFSGLKLEGEEENMCERLWRLYEQPPKKVSVVSQKEPSLPNIPEVQSLSGDSHFSFASFNDPGASKDGIRTASEPLSAENFAHTKLDDIEKDQDDVKNRGGFQSLEELVPEMESLGFTCLPPRKQPLMPGKYLRYVRKKAKDGNALKVLHADYFMVLCACAKVIRVEPVALYWCVQRVENSLRHIEEKARNFSEIETEEDHR